MDDRRHIALRLMRVSDLSDAARALGYDVMPTDGRIARKRAAYGSESLYLGRSY
jgi:hypothetical protein